MHRIIVITGGANGIGRCLVEHFAAQSDEVYFIDYAAEATAILEQTCRNQGHLVTSFVGDVGDKQSLIEFSQSILQKHPDGIHCLINNACLSHGGILNGCTYEDFLYTQQVGVAAPYLLAMLFKDHFIGMGSIVNITSTRAYQSQPNTESYSAAKGALTALTHALAVSLSGIARVNAIAPGWIDTDQYQFHNQGKTHFSASDKRQHPSQRVGQPTDIARTVDFLCDPRNSFINGETITVDGGMSKLMIYHNDEGWSLNDSEG